MTDILEQLKQFSGLDASLYGASVALAVLLRFARAYWKWCDDPHTLAVAVVLGVVGAIFNLSAGASTWQFIGMQALSLSVAVLMVEFGLRKLAETGKVPFLPKDNEFVK